MELREDWGDEGETPELEITSSELVGKKKPKKKAYSSSKGGFLAPGDKEEGHSSSAASDHSKYETAVEGADGTVTKSYVYKRRRNPTYETYLEETSEKPSSLSRPKFLSINGFEKVCMPSYQSSGSTVLRKYLENLTYIITGSDGDIHTKIDKQMKDKAELAGESILGSKVWIAHTNFPEEIGVARTFVNKALLIVRNPCDAIYSHFNKAITRSIDKKLTEEDMEKLSDCWDDFLRQEIKVWKSLHDYWMLEPVIPTYVVRHEDLVNNPRKTLKEVFKFLLNTKSLSGTLIDHLINEETSREEEETYKQNKPGYSFPMYTDDQLSYIESQAGCTLRRLGYGYDFISPDTHISETPFFKNDQDFEDSKEHEVDTVVKNKTEYNVKIRYDYLSLNEMQLKEVRSESYHSKIAHHELEEFELNMEAEHLRTREGNNYSVKGVLRPYKDLIKSEFHHK